VPSEWLRQRKRDHYHRLAKVRGFRSRASFKLLQVAKRSHFLKRGDRVLDLGSAPGGWLQAAREVVGYEGFVLGVDKEDIAPLRYENVEVMKADIAQDELADQIRAKTNVPFDVVVSDISPNLTGVWEVDYARQIDLAGRALKIAHAVLKPKGNMLVKVFQGSDLKQFELDMRSCFRTLRIVKPPASRPESAELYLLGLDFLGQAAQ
jgi:23S rRNA (uridine2552-2'-O)-methyltransferase